MYFAVLPIASPTTRSLPMISVCISAGKEIGSKISVGEAEADAVADSPGLTFILADSLVFEQPVRVNDPKTMNGIHLIFILQK